MGVIFTHREYSAFDGVLLFFAQPKKSNQKKGCPNHFFDLVVDNLFFTHHLRHYVPVLAEIRKIIPDFPC